MRAYAPGVFRPYNWASRPQGWREHVRSFWAIIEFIGIVTSIVACAFYGAKFVAVKLTMKDFQDDPSKCFLPVCIVEMTPYTGPPNLIPHPPHWPLPKFSLFSL